MEGYLGEVWEGPACRSFRPHGAGVCHPPLVDVFTPPKLSKPRTVGILRSFLTWA